VGTQWLGCIRQGTGNGQFVHSKCGQNQGGITGSIQNNVCRGRTKAKLPGMSLKVAGTRDHRERSSEIEGTVRSVVAQGRERVLD